jgi:hypothetical protein
MSLTDSIQVLDERDRKTSRDNRVTRVAPVRQPPTLSR